MNITPQDYGLALEYQHHYSGKVRDIYLTPQGNYLFVASDRISAFDCVLSPNIPDKGKILTQISLWWFERLGVKNHIVDEVIPESVKDRAMVGRPLKMFEVECVVRGYRFRPNMPRKFRDALQAHVVGSIVLGPEEHDISEQISILPRVLGY